MKKITVLLAEDHAIVREGIRRLLESEKDFAVVGEAQNGRQAVELAAKLHPAIVLMDIVMPQLNGLEATRRLLKAVPGAKVLILSAHGEEEYVRTAAAFGAVGFLHKRSTAREVCRAIREVHEGKILFSPSLLAHQARSSALSSDRARPVKRRAAELTPRELEVLQLIAEGKTNKETATALGIGIRTAGKHRLHLMAKLDIHDVAGLTRYAISAGIIEGGLRLDNL